MAEKLYDNQVAASRSILEKLKAGRKITLLVAQCQSGKTGALISLTQQLMLMSTLMGEKKTREQSMRPEMCYSLFLIGPSDTNLRDQTISRFKSFGYRVSSSSTADCNVNIFSSVPSCKSSSAPYYHPTSQCGHDFFGSIKKEKTSGKLALVLFDECHLGAGESGQIKLMCDRYNINMGSSEAVIRGLSDSELIVYCSATPGTQTFGIEAFERKYNVVYLDPGFGYYGIESFMNDKRMLSSFDALKNPNKFKELLKSFKSGEAGSFILRLSDRKSEKTKGFREILSFCKNNNIEIKRYTCNDGNISMLDEDMNKEKDSHTVRIIYKSYLQGKTIKNKHLIRGWFDKIPTKDNLSSHLQSVGRNFGYSSEDYDISKLTYTVWCDVDGMNKATEYYRRMKILSEAGTSFKDDVMTNTYSEKKTISKIPYIIESAFDSVECAENYIRSVCNEYKGRSIAKRSISAQNKRDVAKEIYEGNFGFGELFKERPYGIIDMTKPNQKHVGSFNTLDGWESTSHIKAACKGKYAVIRIFEKEESTDLSNNSSYRSTMVGS